MEKASVYISGQENVSAMLAKMKKEIESSNKNFKNLSGEVEKTSKNFKDLEDKASKSDKVFQTKNKNVKDAENSFGKLALKIGGLAVGFVSLGKAMEGLKSFYDKGLEISADTKTAEIGIAGLYSSLIEFKDENNNMILGGDKFSKSIELARKDVKLLLQDALATSASFAEVREAYTAALAPGLGAGMSRENIRSLSTLVANTANTMQLPAGSLPQEIKALLSGEVTSDATIATALGLGTGGALNAQFKEAQKLGTQYEFLMKIMKDFETAGMKQSETLRGQWSATKEIFEQFASETSQGLEKELLKMGNSMNGIFEKGEWSKELDGLRVILNDIGSFAGSTIAVTFNSIVEFAREIGTYLQEDPRLLIVANNTLELMKINFQSLINIGEQILNTFGIFADTFLNVLGLSGETTQSLSGMQKILVGVHYTVSTIGVAFAAIIDVVSLIADGIRTLIGGAIASILNVLGTVIEMIGKMKSAIGEVGGFFGGKEMEVVFKEDGDFTKKMGEELRKIGLDWGDKAIGKDNKVTSLFNRDADALKKTFENSLKALEIAEKNHESFLSGTFANFDKKLAELDAERKKQEEDAKKPLVGSEKAAYVPKKDADDKKKSKGRIEDLQKLAWQAEMKEIERMSQLQKEKIDDLSNYLELDRRQNLISLQDYFDKKKTLEEEDFKSQLLLIEKQLKITEDQKKNAKNQKDLNVLNDKENQLMNEKIKLINDFTYKQRESSFERMQALKDYSNELKSLDAQILEMTGKEYDAIKIQLDIEAEDLVEKYKNDPVAMSKVNQLNSLKKQDAERDNIESSFNDVMNNYSLKERELSILRDHYGMSELKHSSLIREEKEKNISLLKDEIERMEELNNLSGNNQFAERLQEMRVELLEFSAVMSPVSEELDNLFKDGLVSATKEIITNFENAQDAVDNFFANLSSKLLDLALNEVFSSVVGKGFGSIAEGIVSGKSATAGGGLSGLASAGKSLLGGIFGKNSGGSVKAGELYKINETKEEFFRPATNGVILNSAQTSSMIRNQEGGRGRQVIQNISVVTKDYNSFRNSESQMKAQALRMLNQGNRNF